MYRGVLPLLPFLLVASVAGTSFGNPYDDELEQRRERFFALTRSAGNPEAVVPLLGITELYELVSDRTALQRFVEEAAAERPGVLPEVRARAKATLRELLHHAGQGEAGSKLTEELGIIREFEVLGPFDNEGGKGHGTAYPPELDKTAPSGNERYEGKLRTAPPRWRNVPKAALGRDGRVLLDAMLHPDSAVTAYASCYVENPTKAPLRIQLRVGSTGPLRVFVNQGQTPVLDRNLLQTRSLHLDQEVAQAKLSPGWNRILVKLSVQEGPWAFLLRLTASDGSRLKDLHVSATPPKAGMPLPAYLPPDKAVPPSGQPLHLSLAAAAKKGKDVAQLPYGLYLHYVAPGDPDSLRAAPPLTRAANGSPLSARILAATLKDDNERRHTLEEALRRFSDKTQPPCEIARLHLDLGKLYEEGRRVHLAEPAYQTALSLCPGLFPAAVELAQIHASRGLPAEGLRTFHLATATQRNQSPRVPLRLLKAEAQLRSRLGQRKEVDDLYRRIADLGKDDMEALRHLLDIEKNRGQVDNALQILDRMIALRPDILVSYGGKERVEVLEGSGRIKDALSTLDQMLQVAEAEPDLYQTRGRLLLRLHRSDEAMASYKRSLELKPQNPDLRTYLRHLDPQSRSKEDLSKGFRVDVKELARKQQGRPQSDKRNHNPAQVLLDQHVVRIHDNGLSETYSQRVLQILDERGAREQGELDIRYTPETQSVEIKSAEVHKKTGEVQQAAILGERDVSEPWYGLYYDVRAQSLRFDGLTEGDVISVEYVISDVGRKNLFSDYFGDLHYLQEDIPRLQSRYVLLVSPERPLYFNQPGKTDVSVKRSERIATTADKRERVIVFEADNVPRIDIEPGMPGFSEVAAYVHVSTYKSWEDVATWYTGLIAEQLTPSPEMIEAAKKAVAGLVDERQKVRAIHNLVIKGTRYVGLEFGIHGFKPYKVSQVYARKFGDCKDKAALLKVLLKEVGIESTMVLARTRRNGDLRPEPASLAAFDHAIVYVPSQDLYLDGTAEFSGATELPAEDQDIPVLLVTDQKNGGRGRLVRTPVLRAVENTVQREIEVQLHKDGAGRLRDRVQITGQAAPKWREHYQAQGSQKERYEKAWNDIFPGAKVLKVELPRISDVQQPVALHGDVEIPNWGRRQQEGGNELVVKPLGRDPDLLRGYARLSQRRHDLILGYPWRNLERVTLRLPQGWQIRRAPLPKTIESPFGRFVLQVTKAKDQLLVQGELEVNRHRIAQKDYAAFRAFCAQVDSAVEQELVVSP